MIGKVSFNSINTASFQGNSNILDKFKENLNLPEAVPANLNGNEALGNYNIAAVNKKDFNEEAKKLVIADIPEPIRLSGNEIESLNSEKIYNSDGKLGIIVVKGDKTSKEYYVDDDTHRIEQVIERDNESGMPVRTDSFGFLYNKDVSATVGEFYPGTNKLAKETYFTEGSLSGVKRFDDDKIVSNEFDKSGKLDYITVTDRKTGMITEYNLNDKGNVEEFSTRDELFTRTKSTEIVDNKIGETREFKSEPIENIYGITPDNIDLKPSEFIEKPDISKLEGEKKFRSDNSLESIIVKDGDKKTEYFTDIKGNIEEIKFYSNEKLSKSIGYRIDGGSIVTDFSDDKTSKTTYFNKDRQVNLIILRDDEEGNIIKSADFTSDGRYLTSYEEENNPKYGKLYLKFDGDKNLISAENTKSTITVTKGEQS